MFVNKITHSRFWQSLIFLVAFPLNAADYGLAQYGLDDNSIKIDVDYRFQAWAPDDIYGADLLTTGLNLIGLQLGYATDGGSFTPMVRYEFAPGGDSATQSKLLELSSDEASGWERLIADMKWNLASGNSISFVYDKQSYLTSVQTTRDYWYFDGSSVTLLVPGEIVRSSTVMQDIQILYGTPLYKIGFFSLTYEKPLSTDIQNGQIGIYRTKLDAMGIVASSQYKMGKWNFGGSLKYGLQSDLTIGASSSAAKLLGAVGDTLDFIEMTASVQVVPYRGDVDVKVGAEYKLRSMSGDGVQLTRDDVMSFYINVSKSF